MKRLWIVVLLNVTCFSFLVNGSIVEDRVVEFLEEFRNRMCHPIAKWGLPALDPLEVSHIEVTMNNDYMANFSSSITDAYLTGLSDFIINEITITLPRRRFLFDITLPLTAFKALYTANGFVAFLVNVSGRGVAQASVAQLRIVINGSLRFGYSLGIRNLKIGLTVFGLEIDFESLTKEKRINDFIHALVNELGIELLGDAWQIEQERIQETLQEHINSLLGLYSLSDIISIIKGDNPIFQSDDPPADCKNLMRQITPSTNTF